MTALLPSSVLGLLVCATAVPPADRPLASTAAVNALIADGMRERRYFDLTGTVVHASPRGFTLDDGLGRVAFFSNVLPSPRTGDVVRVGGWTRDNGDRWSAIAYSDCHVLGHANVPPRRNVTVRDVLSGHFNLSDVYLNGCTIEDVLRDEIDPDWNIAVLRDGDDTILAYLNEKALSFEKLSRLVGARIRLRCTCSNSAGGDRTYVGIAVKATGPDDIDVIAQPPDAERVPQLTNFFAKTPREIVAMGRRTADGRVLVSWNGDRFLLLTPSGTVMRVELADGEALPRPGQEIRVTGYPETDLFRINLTRARVCTSDDGTAPSAGSAETKIHDLSPRLALFTSDGRPAIRNSLYGKVLRFAGTVLTMPKLQDFQRTFEVLENGFRVRIDASALDALPADLAVGCIAEITGICVLDYDAWRPNVPITRCTGLTIVLRTPEDIRVIRAAPWLTPLKLLVAFAVLGGLLIWVALWNRALKARAERRGRELAAERLAHEKASIKVEERTRLAVELHDSVSQALTGIALQVESAQAARKCGTRSPDGFLDSAARMLASCREELQGCLWDLRNRTFEERDLTEAVQRTLAPYLSQTTASVRFNVPREALSENATHNVLRIVRELAINAIRHGHATRLRIAGELHDGRVCLTVRDNGLGFDPLTAPGPKEGHFGLQGIRERIARLDGHLAYKRLPEGGMRAFVSLRADKGDFHAKT